MSLSVTRMASRTDGHSVYVLRELSDRVRKGLLAICALRETSDARAVHPCRWLTKLDAGNRGIEGTGYGESVPCWVVGGERFSCP
jgi:hypothetical protein